MADFLIDKGTKNLIEGLSKSEYAPSEVIPITKGGTGAATLEQARANLGISPGNWNLLYDYWHPVGEYSVTYDVYTIPIAQLRSFDTFFFLFEKEYESEPANNERNTVTKTIFAAYDVLHVVQYPVVTDYVYDLATNPNAFGVESIRNIVIDYSLNEILIYAANKRSAKTPGVTYLKPLAIAATKLV